MAEEQVNNTEENIMNPLEAYNILLQRQMSEDRIVVERTNIFFLAQSFLFMAFIALLNPDLPAVCNIIRIALPVIGILLTLLLYHLNQAAINASSFWHVGQRKIEEEDTFFNYMWENEITPHTHGWECTWGQK